MKTKRSKAVNVCVLLGLGLLAGTASAQLSVVNGGFSDLTGLTLPGGDWRSGVPFGWTSTHPNSNYSVDVGKGSPPPVANLQSLTVLSQTVGTLASDCDVVLSFDFLNPWNRTGNRVSAVLLAGSAVIASNRFDTLGSGLTLVATNVASGSAISIQFINASVDGNGAPGLDNIAVGAFAVGAPPTILQQPARKSAMLPGTTATLSVAAIGVPPLDYQWRTNGVALADATNALLTVTAWQTNYTVVVTAPNGASVTSQVAQVVDTVVNGDFSDLTGLTASGNWYGGVPVGWSVATSQYMVNTAMGATPPTLNLDGKTVTQTLGTLTNVSDVVVSFVLSQPFNATATTADAFLMNGAAVLASGRYAFTTQGQSVSATLAATNVPAGAALAVKFIEVSGGAPGLDNVVAAVFATNGPPLITAQPKTKNAMPDGTSVTLSATAFGVPPLAYQWLTNGLALAGATHAALTVTQAGDYRVAVTAPNGTSVTSDLAEVVGSLVNGDFSDLSGMTPTVSGWYSGLPPGWSSTEKPGGGDFAVATEGASGGATPPTCNPSSLNRLQQEAGTLLRASHVTLRFDLPFGFNGQTWATLRASLLNAATGATLATGDFGVGVTGLTLKALNVPAGTPIMVDLQSLFNTTPALDNVSVTVTRPGLLFMLN
jgi:hypothetical protein